MNKMLKKSKQIKQAESSAWSLKIEAEILIISWSWGDRSQSSWLKSKKDFVKDSSVPVETQKTHALDVNVIPRSKYKGETDQPERHLKSTLNWIKVICMPSLRLSRRKSNLFKNNENVNIIQGLNDFHMQYQEFHKKYQACQ